jgi:hypothetical protein
MPVIEVGHKDIRHLTTTSVTVNSHTTTKYRHAITEKTFKQPSKRNYYIKNNNLKDKLIELSAQKPQVGQIN